MSPIVSCLGTAGWPLSQQRTIFSKTRKTSPLCTIHVMVSFVIIIGCLNVPHTDGHRLEEHWKDPVHRKKLPTISPNEQRTSHDLPSSSHYVQNKIEPISPNRFTTNTKKHTQAGNNPLPPANDRRTTTSWLHPKDETLNNHGQRFNISAGNQRVEISRIVNSSRSSTNDRRSSKWQTANIQHVRSLAENTPVSVTFGSTTNSIQTNPVLIETSLSDLTKNQESRDNKSNREKQLTTHNLADKPTEFHNAVTTDGFSPQIPNRKLPVTMRRSIGRNNSPWKSRDTAKVTVATFYPRSLEYSSDVTKRKEINLEENGQAIDNIRKSVPFPDSRVNEDTNSRASRVGSKKGSDHVEPETFPFDVPNKRSKISPMREMPLNPRTTIFAPKKTVIKRDSIKKSTLFTNTGKLKGKSTKILKRNKKTISAHQDTIINTQKPSWSPFSSTKLSHSFQSNPITNTPSQVLLTLPKELNSQIDRYSLVRDTDELDVPTMEQKRYSLIPTSTTKRSRVNQSLMSNANRSSPEPGSLPTTTTLKRRRRKKGRNNRRQRLKKTTNKKPSLDSWHVSPDREDMFLYTEQIRSTKNKAGNYDALFEERNKQQFKTSADHSVSKSIMPKTPVMTSETSSPLEIRPSSAAVDSDDWLDTDYPEIREGLAEEGLAWLKESRSEARIHASARNENWFETNGERQTARDIRRLFKTGLPPDDQDESDLKSQTNRSPPIIRFISKKRKVSVRNRKMKDNLFQKTKFPNFEPFKSSGPDPVIKDFSNLNFAKIGSVLKTTVKRSARPMDAITPIPNKKKNGVDPKKRKILPRKQKNTTNDLQIPNLETLTVDEIQSSPESDSDKKDVIHSKQHHSLFDHDGASESKNMKTQTMAEQTTDSASVLYSVKEENVPTLKSKTNSPFSGTPPVSFNMFSAISTPSTKNYTAGHQSTHIGSHHQKDSLHATTDIYDRPKSSTSLPFAFDEKNPDEKKKGLSVTQTPYSVINGTTHVPAHFSSRIIRGTDESRSPQMNPATASSDKIRNTMDKSSLKNDSSIETDFNIKLPSTYASVQPQTVKSSSPSLTEITPVQVTESIESHVSSQRSNIFSKSMQYVTVSSHQADNTSSKNGFLTNGHFTSSSSPRITNNSSKLVNLHKEHRQELVSNGDSFKERSSSSTHNGSEDIFREASSSSGAISLETSTVVFATRSTPKSRSNKNSPEGGSTNKRLPYMESITTVSTANPNLETSRSIVTSTKGNVRDKITPSGAISHDEQHHFLHPTTSSPSSFLSFPISKSPSSSSSIHGSGRTQSSPVLQPAKTSSPVVTNNIHEMTTTPRSVDRTPDTTVSTLQVSKERQDNQHRSTTKPLIKRPQSSKIEPSKFPSTTFTISPTTKTTTDTRRISVASSKKTSKGTTTKKPIKENMSTIKTENFKPTPRRKPTKNTIASKTTISVANNDESVSTPKPTNTVSLKEHDEQPKPPLPPNSPDYKELLVKCKVKPNIDINGKGFENDIKEGLVNSYLEGWDLLKQRKAGSTNKRRRRDTSGYVLEHQFDAHGVHYEETEGIEAKLLRRSRTDQLVEIHFQMLEYGSVIDTDTAINVFSQLRITEISVNLNYPIYHQIEAFKHVMSRTQQPLRSSATKWMMVTIAAPSIPVFCVICILLTSWYRNHARLRRKAMAEISRGSQYAESLADVGLEIDMEKGEIVSRAGSTSVLWADFAAGDTLERMGMAGDFPNTDGESSRSNSWNARGDSRTNANQSGRGRRQSPVARQCQRSGKYVKKKDSVSSFHFENNLEDECPPVYESFEPALNDCGQWPRTSTLQSRTTPGRHLNDQQRKDISSTSQIYGDSILSSSQKLRPTLHANIISHFLAELDTL